jgi:hypothetical protein
MNEVAQIFQNAKKHDLLYCDYIAHLISHMLPAADQVSDGLINMVGKPKMDLDRDGVYLSADKKIGVVDKYGSVYEIIVRAI